MTKFQKYKHESIEPKWQEYWDTHKTFIVNENDAVPKYYILSGITYPSTNGLYIGSLRTYVTLDVVARKRRLEAYNVLFAIGWDAFLNDIEEFAIKNKIHPKKLIEKNKTIYKKHLKTIGLSFDWEREIDTSDPEYYKWTQWIFIKLFEKGLVYRYVIPYNWCPHCNIYFDDKVVLNEQCNCCGRGLIEREKEVWKLKITEYAEWLLNDLEKINFDSTAKHQLEDWILESIRTETNSSNNILKPDSIWAQRTNIQLSDICFFSEKYWGELIPMIFCNHCGWIPVPEEDLPVKLPDISNFQPTNNGESPLAIISEWANVRCPKCNSNAKRETDTMPQGTGILWNFLRHTDPHNEKLFADINKLRYWMPVDWYDSDTVSSMSQLLRSRFWYKFLFDLRLVPCNEPYLKRTIHGPVYDENCERMSISKGNLVKPEDIVKEYGADSLRICLMYLGRYDSMVPWSQRLVIECHKFLQRVWNLPTFLINENDYSKSLEFEMHDTTRKVSKWIESGFNSNGIESLMQLVKSFFKIKKITIKEFKDFLIILNPFAPHITEELWTQNGYEGHVYEQNWPCWDESLLTIKKSQIVIYINGKARGTIEVSIDEIEEEVKKIVFLDERFKKYIQDKRIIKEYFIKNKVYSLVFE